MEFKNDLSMTEFFLSYSFICVYAHLNMHVTWLRLSEWLPHSAAAYIQMPLWNAQADIRL
jgi:hypothetical protein